MPRISVLIPAYNVEPYIDACLESVRNQSFTDLDIVIVDDASTDGTLGRIEHHAAEDPRIRIVRHEVNRGLHVARKSAVAAMSGDYAIFLDADDDLSPYMCEALVSFVAEHPAQMVRYGMDVIPETPEDSVIAHEYQQMFNASAGDLEEEDVLEASFSTSLGVWVPWNVHTTLYSAPLLTQAFADSVDRRLSRIEDAYEYLLITSRARNCRAFTELHGLRYHIGRGISSRAPMGIERFTRDQRSIFDVLTEIRAFVKMQGDERLLRAQKFFKERCLLTIREDLRFRLAGYEYRAAFEAIHETWGEVVARELLVGLILERGYWLKSIGTVPNEGDHFSIWYAILEDFPLPVHDEKLREIRELHQGFHAQLQAQGALEEETSSQGK